MMGKVCPICIMSVSSTENTFSDIETMLSPWYNQLTKVECPLLLILPKGLILYFILRSLLFAEKQHLGDCSVTGRL